MCSSLSDSAAVPRGKETRSDCDSIHRNSAFLAQDSGVDARHADPAGLGRIDGLLGGVPALVGLLSIVGIGSGSYTTHCPVCDKELRGLIGLTRCPQCLCYGKVSEGEYSELQPDCVTEVPLLALPLGNRREMPPLCCACGAPAALRVIPDPWCRADCHRG